MRTAEPLDLSDYSMGHTTAHYEAKNFRNNILFFFVYCIITDINFSIRISKIKQRRETARPLQKDMRNLSKKITESFNGDNH